MSRARAGWLARWCGLLLVSIPLIVPPALPLRWALALAPPHGRGWSPAAFGGLPPRQSIAYVLIDEQQLFVSTDGGVTWEARPLPVAEGSYRVVAHPGQDATVYLITREPRSFGRSPAVARIYRSVDAGTTWELLGQELPPVADFQTPYAATTFIIDPFVSSVWYTRRGSVGRDTTRVPGLEAPVYRSTDGGVTWTGSPLPPPVAAADVLALAADPTTPGRLYAILDSPEHRIAISLDQGATWHVADETLKGGPLYAGDVTLVVHPTSAGLLYVGASGHCGVLKSADGGHTWTEAATGLPLSPAGFTGTIGPSSWKVAALATDPLSPDTVYAGMSVLQGGAAGTFADTGGIYKSTDGGASWQPANDGLPQDTSRALNYLNLPTVGIRHLAVDPRAPEVVYAIHHHLPCPRCGSFRSGIIYQSRDGGTTWARAPMTIPPAQFIQLAIGWQVPP